MLLASFNSNEPAISILSFLVSAFLSLLAMLWGIYYARGMGRKIIALVVTPFLSLSAFLVFDFLRRCLQWPASNSKSDFEVCSAIGTMGVLTGLAAFLVNLAVVKLGRKKATLPAKPGHLQTREGQDSEPLKK